MAIETITIDTEQWAVVSKGALQMVVNALRRDAEDGRGVRGEMADELLAAAPRPMPTASIEQAPDVLSEAIHYVGNKDLGGLVTREFLSGANAIIKALEEYRDEFSRDSAPVPITHSDDLAVEQFAMAMKAKLAKKRDQGRGGWETCPPEILSKMLIDHIAKGDPVDVANFCMMLHQTGNRIVEQPRPVPTAIPMSERLPFHTDADYGGLILAFTRFTKEWVLQAWTHVHNCPNAYTHWQPTGLVRPAEPDGGAV